MTQTDMGEKDRRKANRIPVRFVGDEAEQGRVEGQPEVKNEGDITPDEIGRESAYEDETETQRRVERGDEQDTGAGRSSADDDDLAGGPDPSELPRSRGDQDTTASHTDDGEKSSGDDARASSAEPPRQADSAAGPALAELIATRSELRRVEGELKKLSDERQDLVDKLARRQADFDNFRKRTERERSETYNRSLGEVVRRLFPVLDNLQRALDAERTIEVEESEEFRHFLRGIELINRQFGGVLESLGVEVVPTVGELFDPHVHEAVSTEEAEEVEPDTIVQEMQRGYRLGDKLLRPAMVKVATRQ
ncbi:MAG TPA: nucleotide exchange factor GrpE [Pyrinomonadaceae bacterium]|nr:nucleotide exchange factor GrpE [Pyrinomonadaceae bacterium]